MSEYVSREELLSRINRTVLCSTHEAREIIDSIPSADVRPNIHGHWIATPECDTCSECHFKVVAGFNFCPHCGADMREPIGEKGTE